jgi:MYXO-CTERM domain-containing protein
MNMKGVALAGALLLSASATSAFADTVETVGSYGSTTINKTTDNLTTALFKVFADTDYIFSVFVDGTKNAGNDRFLVASLLDSVNTVISSFTIQSNPASNTDRNFSSGPLSLAEGFYRIAFKLNTPSGGNPVFINTSASLTHTVQTVAVPGPEAGAGIGALAMAGVAYLAMKRRRSLPA